MKRNFVLALLLVSSFAVAQEDHNHTHSNYEFKKNHQAEFVTTQRLGVTANLRNFSRSSDRAKIEGGFEVLKEIINSERFKELVLGFTFRGENEFNDSNGMTNAEIYNLLMSGAEVLKPEVDHKMDFDLTLYRSWNPFSKVKGYTKPGTLRIWVHTKFFRRRSWTYKDVAANLAHEWVHKVGFGHDYNYNQDRPFSVPYGIGGIVVKVAEELGY